MNKSLHIAEPCHENWGNMSPTEKGKFCQVCTKEVMDFTSKSKEEIIEHIEQSTTSICGRFHADQLDSCGPTTSATAKKKFNYSFRPYVLSFMAFIGFSILFNKQADAQRKMGKVAVKGRVKYIPERTDEVSKKQATTIEGVVSESGSNRAIPNAKVTINSNGTLKAVAFTDAEGKYKIVLPAGTVTASKVNVVVTDQYGEYEVRYLNDVALNKEKMTLNVDMEFGMMLMGEVAWIEPVETIEPVDSSEITCDLIKVVEDDKAMADTAAVEELMMGQAVVLLPEERVADPLNEVAMAGVEESVWQGTASIKNNPQPLKTTEDGDALEPSAKVVELLYPNPARDYCVLEMSEEGDYSIEIYDITGKGVMKDRFMGRKKRINLYKLERGVYSIRVTSLHTEHEQAVKLVVD